MGIHHFSITSQKKPLSAPLDSSAPNAALARRATASPPGDWRPPSWWGPQGLGAGQFRWKMSGFSDGKWSLISGHHKTGDNFDGFRPTSPSESFFSGPWKDHGSPSGSSTSTLKNGASTPSLVAQRPRLSSSHLSFGFQQGWHALDWPGMLSIRLHHNRSCQGPAPMCQPGLALAFGGGDWWHIWPLHCGWNQHPFESQWRAGWNLSPCCQPHNNPEHPRLNKNLLHLKKTIATWTASKNNQFSSLKFNKKTYCLNLIFTEITTSTIKMQQEVSLSRHVQWEHLCTNIQSPYIRSLSVGLPTYQSINLSIYQSINLSSS